MTIFPGGGGAGGVPPTIQDAYENSDSPQLVTDATNEALVIQEGTGVNANDVFQVRNNSSSITLRIRGNGRVVANEISVDGFDLNLSADALVGGTNTGDAGPPTITYLTTGTAATFTPEIDTIAILVKPVGGGGGAGGADGAGGGTAAASEGGGGGGWGEKLFTNMSQTFTFTIGAAGIGGNGNNPGTDGGTTTFTGSVDGSITATGGKGGLGSNGTSSSLINRGADGGTCSGGDLNCSGDDSSETRVYLGIIYSLSRSGASVFGGSLHPEVTNAGKTAGSQNYGAGGGSTSQGAVSTITAGGDGIQGVIQVVEFK